MSSIGSRVVVGRAGFAVIARVGEAQASATLEQLARHLTAPEHGPLRASGAAMGEARPPEGA